MANRDKRTSFFNRRLLLPALLVIPLLLIASTTYAQLSERFLQSRAWLEVDLHSVEEADYSPDKRTLRVPPLQMSILADVLRDLDPQAADLEPRLTLVAERFPTAVDTVQAGEAPTPASPSTATLPPTPGPSPTLGPSLTPTLSSTPGPSPTATDTHTPGPSPTATKTFTPGPSPTATKTPTRTLSPTPGPSPTATKTPTRTLSPTPGPSPTATKTSTTAPLPTVTSTATQVPTATRTPSQVPTNTQAPPTATNTEDACDNISLTNFSVEGQQVSWSLSNDSGSAIEITEIYINWPGVNEELVKIELSGDAIWDKKDDSPPTNITSGWKSGVSRTVSAGESTPLLFQFEQAATSNGYVLRVTFDNGCVSRGER